MKVDKWIPLCNAGKKRFKNPSEREKMSEVMRNARATKFWSTKKKPNLGVNSLDEGYGQRSDMPGF